MSDINSNNIINYIGEGLIKSGNSARQRVIVVGVEHSHRYPHQIVRAVVKGLYEKGDVRCSVPFEELSIPRIKLKAGDDLSAVIKHGPLHYDFKVIAIVREAEEVGLLRILDTALLGDSIPKDLEVVELVEYINSRLNDSVVSLTHNGYIVYEDRKSHQC